MKPIKITIVFSLVIALITSWLNPQTVQAMPNLTTNAKSSALIDVTSGRILFSEDGDTQMRIASLTKIMTAIVAIEHGNLSDMVKVSKRAVGKEGSSIYLQLGEEMSLTNLLYGLMLRSGNDAATAIAEHVGGTEEGFVYLMNEKAEKLGLRNTQFQNPHGLDQDGHYSSANDLAKLTAYALKNDVFAEIVKTREKKVPNPHEKWNYFWRNKNKMLNLYDGADGVKTGYTKKAFRCLVSSATRDGQQLVAVTINDGDDWADHSSMLNWGFENYPLITLAEKKKTVQGTNYVYGKSLRYPLNEEEKLQITAQLQEMNKRSIHYTLGERGKMKFYLNGTHIYDIPVYEANSSRLKFSNKPVWLQQSFKQFENERNEQQRSWAKRIVDNIFNMKANKSE